MTHQTSFSLQRIFRASRESYRLLHSIPDQSEHRITLTDQSERSASVTSRESYRLCHTIPDRKCLSGRIIYFIIPEVFYLAYFYFCPNQGIINLVVSAHIWSEVSSQITTRWMESYSNLSIVCYLSVIYLSYYVQG